jgi:hypothetical protein
MAAEKIEVGYQAYVDDGGEEFGAVRGMSKDGRSVMVYVEGTGDFLIPLDAVRAVHSQKVVFDCAKLDDSLKQAIGHAHDREEPGL